MEHIRVLIAEDEPLARGRLVRLVSEAEGFEVVGEAANGRAAIRALQETDPDLLLLDIQMPDLDGFGVLRAVEAGGLPAVVFVTAYDEYALKAFDLHAVDYLLKPYTAERLHCALDRARERIRAGRLTGASDHLLALLRDLRPHKGLEPDPARVVLSAGTPGSLLDRIAVKGPQRLEVLRADEIDYVQAAGVYVELHVGGHVHLLRETLSNLEGRLDPARFRRIHRSTIVNLDRVRALEPLVHGDFVVCLRDGTRLRTSRAYRDRLRDALEQLG